MLRSTWLKEEHNIISLVFLIIFPDFEEIPRHTKIENILQNTDQYSPTCQDGERQGKPEEINTYF